MSYDYDTILAIFKRRNLTTSELKTIRDENALEAVAPMKAGLNCYNITAYHAMEAAITLLDEKEEKKGKRVLKSLS